MNIRQGGRRLAFRLLAAACLVAALGWASARGVAAWRYGAELDRASMLLAARDFAPARDAFARLAATRPGLAELESPLGTCEAALGRVDRALAAWARVPRDSDLYPRAALDRAALALEHGRLATADEAVAPLLDRSDAVGERANRLAMQVDLYAGRRGRIAGRLERLERLVADRAPLLRARWLLDTQPSPVESLRAALDKFAREAPDDDRVWLGQADLALQAGRLDEADAILRRCEARRPGDFDVGRARLEWVLRAGRADEATRAMAALPADQFDPGEVAELRARLASAVGDAQAERAALERRVELVPGDPSAWSRLADLAARDGRTAEVARFRSRKAEIDRALDEYRMQMGAVAAGDLSGVVDLARTAETLGRQFEARGWWTLLALRDPGDREARAALARLAADPKSKSAPDGRSLADAAGIRPGPAKASSPPSPSGLVVPTFRDDAKRSGLRFTYRNDRTDLRRLPETMGGGLGLIDFDGDGYLDVYAVQGGTFPDGGGGPDDGDRLFRNRGDGTFEDATARSGLASFPRGYGHGVAVGDYDGDGHADLFVTRWRSYSLYRNRGDGTFEDATGRSGLGGDRGWPTSSAFGDLDNDGDLDLYVCQYLKWDPDSSPPCPDPEHPDRHAYCTPRGFEAEPDRVYRNDGGVFVDVTAEAGVDDRTGRGLGVVIADLDDDGKVDIYVANDMTANFLFRNLGGFRFEEVGESSGAGANAEGGYQAGMGIACGDIDGDGRPDLAVTNFYGESTTLYQNLGGGFFADRTDEVGLSTPSRYLLGFGAAFLDANADGRLDLATANGHVNDNRPSTPYAMPAQLALGIGGGRVADVTARAGACWTVPRVGRGLAAGDLDNDGRVDLLILAQGEPMAYLRNLGPGGHWLTLGLEGTASNRDGVGATVRLLGPGPPQVARRIGGGSFLSASDGRLHLGLGEASPGATASVEVRWPSGRVDRHDGLAIDAGHRLVEGDPNPRSIAARPAPG